MKKILCSIAVSLTILSMLACSLTRALVKPAPTPTPLPGIASQWNMTPEENQALVGQAHADSQGGALLDWALSTGVLTGDKATAGVDIAMEGGDIYQGVALQNAQLIKYTASNYGLSVYFLSQVSGSRTDPQLTLLTQTTTTVYSKDSITINGQPVGQINSSSVSPVSCRLPSLVQSVPNAGCTTTGEEVFKNCMGGAFLSFTDRTTCMAALGLALTFIGSACFVASAPTGETVLLPCLATVLAAVAGASLGKCPKYAECVVYSTLYYQPPDIKVTSWTRTGASKWINISQDPQNGQWVHATIYKPQVSVTDDWNPAPTVDPPPDSLTAASGETVTITATDCHGKTTSKTFKAPDLTEAEMATRTNVDPNAPKPVSPPQGNQPPPANPAAPIADITYDGFWTGEYEQQPSDPSTRVHMCNENTFTKFAFTLSFSLDGTITMHDCEGEMAVTSCKVDFKPGKTEGTYIDINNPGRSLLFTTTERFDVVMTLQSTMKSGDPSFCQQEFTARVSP